MASSFFVVPQWQGSSSSRAMQLVEGATAIGGDLPLSRTVVVPIPPGAGSDQGSGVRRLSSVETVRDELRTALAKANGTPIVIGGDCGVELAAIAHAAGTHKLAVVWFDAHADLNNTQTSPSGAFHGMVLRTLLGDGPATLVPETALDPARVVLAGTRALDSGELDFIADSGIRSLPPGELTPAALAEALRDSGADAVYLHIDLDVLDPGEFGALDFPEPFGVSVTELIELIRTAKATLPLAGAGLTEFSPRSPAQADDELPTILRIIGALTSASAGSSNNGRSNNTV
ncbi:arginase family protein [Homoserinimonas sp. A447]